jgi:tetratricopeptide (TPR) repeat protein
MITAHIRSFGLVLLAALMLSGCKPEGFINKTNYQGQKTVNTCADFTEQVNALLEANQGTQMLRVAEYDNSQFEYFYLEPGQMMIVGDTLYARLVNDIEYDRFLAKRVAVLVKLKYKAQDHLRDMEQEAEGAIENPLTIDRAYFDANRDPFFVYKFPVGNRVDGKQISLEFSIDPGCCSEVSWREVAPQSVVQVPELLINDENYRYQGFTGTLDLIFPINSVKYNQDELNDVLLNYISKYSREGFKVKGVNLTGWASLGGKVEYNQRLSDNRSKAVNDRLTTYFNDQSMSSVMVSSRGRGEDWERFDILVKTAVFTDDERRMLLEISNSSMSEDEKEARLRKLPFWEKLVREVLVYCRHVMVEFTFEYSADRMFVENYPTQMPVIAPELYNVATKKMTVSRYQQGTNAQNNMRVLNTLIDVNSNKTANLYAMRSTYHNAMNDIRLAIQDIENAMQQDRENMTYGLAALSYKTRIADTYSLDQRMTMLNEYNTYLNRTPNNAMLRQNRVVMMDKVGFISGALAEYSNMITEQSRGAALLNNRGVARMKTNRIVEAEADFQEAIRSEPTMAEAYYNLAIIHAYKGNPEKCLDNLTKAIELNAGLKGNLARNPAFNIVKANARFQSMLR